MTPVRVGVMAFSGGTRTPAKFRGSNVLQEAWLFAEMRPGDSGEAHNPLRPAQAELVAFPMNGKSIFVVSEKANSPVVRYGAPD